MVVFRPNGNWDRAFRSPGGMVGRYLSLKGSQVVVLSQRFVGVDSGATRRSIRKGRVTRHPWGLQIEVRATTRHALVHHQGSRPRVIRARPGGVMRFQGRRGTVFATRVNHPGTRPNRYLTRALRIAVPPRRRVGL